MFALHFFCQGTHCPDTVGGQICPPPGMIKLANRPVCLGLKRQLYVYEFILTKKSNIMFTLFVIFRLKIESQARLELVLHFDQFFHPQNMICTSNCVLAC